MPTTPAAVHALELRIRRSVPAAVRAVRPDGSFESVSIDRVRVGEEILVEDGEIVGVDGMVARGSAVVLLHPTSRSPVRRIAGQPVLAGARIVEGRLRVLATHVGPDRALLRPLRFGDASAADAAPLTRLVARLLALAAAVVAVGVVLAVILAAPEGGLGARLAAGAAVLVAVPVLALRRASSAPFAAAALAAAERGITYASARALDRAGRVTTAVLSVRPGVESLRPPAVTGVPNLVLAGDWTATGWPSTMEGAVRSGRLAAAAVGRSLGVPVRGPAPDLPTRPHTRLLAGGRDA
jgi:cation transport ATPase